MYKDLGFMIEDLQYLKTEYRRQNSECFQYSNSQFITKTKWNLLNSEFCILYSFFLLIYD